MFFTTYPVQTLLGSKLIPSSRILTLIRVSAFGIMSGHTYAKLLRFPVPTKEFVSHEVCSTSDPTRILVQIPGRKILSLSPDTSYLFKHVLRHKIVQLGFFSLSLCLSRARPPWEAFCGAGAVRGLRCGWEVRCSFIKPCLLKKRSAKPYRFPLTLSSPSSASRPGHVLKHKPLPKYLQDPDESDPTSLEENVDLSLF